MAAAVKNFTIEQGATWTLGFNWHRQGPDDVDGNPTVGDPYDLTGCFARMQIRRRPRADEAVIVTATSAEPVDAEAIEDGAGRIALGGVTGRIDITLTDLDTNKVVRECVYDLEIVWPEQPEDLRPHVDRVLEGTLTPSLNVTLDD